MEWITTANPVAETWRRLLEFANRDFATSRLVKLHGEAKNKTDRANYAKQALQIRVSLLQAREYFAAAESASLFTSPNHLYYGAYSLASAIMLLRGGGTKSFDYLRKEPRNAQHGLAFTTGISGRAGAKGLALLENSHVYIREYGHFANWHPTLERNEPCFAFINHKLSGHTTSIYEAFGMQKTADFQELRERNWTLLELCQRLPDLMLDLRRYGVALASTRSTYVVDLNADRSVRQYRWSLHSASTTDQLMEILDRFRVRPDEIDTVTTIMEERASSCIVIVDANRGQVLHYPSIRDTLEADQIMFALDLDTHEIVDSYLLLFGFSMLARYFPDLWVDCLDSHAIASKLVERVLSTLAVKLPALVLSQLANDRVYISTHRPPWHT